MEAGAGKRRYDFFFPLALRGISHSEISSRQRREKISYIEISSRRR
jgi:hypothetical protein